MNRRPLSLVVMFLLGLGACHRSAPAPEAAPAPTTPPGGGMDGVTKPLMQVLSDEKDHRPSDTPSAEAIFAALDKGGIPTQDATQVMGRMVGAAFCENAHTAQGIVVSVCEFNDADTLTKGRAYSQKAFATALPNRVLLVNKKTLLTINPPDTSPGNKTQVETIGRLFAAL